MEITQYLSENRMLSLTDIFNFVFLFYFFYFALSTLGLLIFHLSKQLKTSQFIAACHLFISYLTTLLALRFQIICRLFFFLCGFA